MRIILTFFLCLTILGFTVAEIQESAPTSGPLPPKSLWQENGLEINNTPGNASQQNPKIINSENGHYLAIWEDGRNGYINLYAQKIDESGNKVWIADGIRLSKSDGNQNFFQAIGDGNGGAIVTWQDYRNGNADIYAQRINAKGEVLWAAEGVAVSKASAGQFAPELTTDGASGAIIVWHDYRNAGGEDIYAQRIGKEGTLLWQADGISVCAATGTQWYPKISGDGASGAIIVWTDGRGSSSDNNIYAQRVDYAGKTLWEKDGVAICAASQNQERPVILGVEDGAIVAWNDSRSNNIDIYAQKIGLDGKSLWIKDGVAITNTPFSQEKPKLVSDGLGGTIVVWTDNRGDESSIFAQRINKEGLINWQENGLQISKSTTKQENPEIVKSTANEWVITWEDYKKDFASLFAQKINRMGIPLWQEGGIALSAVPGAQEKPSIVMASGGVITIWQDRRNGNSDLYAQKLLMDGSLSWDEKGVSICNALGSVIHQNITMLYNQGEIILAFEDARSGFFNVYAQKISPAGALLWGKDGIAVAKVRADQTNPQIVSDGAGGAIIVWEDARDPNAPKIYAQRLGSSGKKLWNKGSLPLSGLPARQSHPLLASDGANGAIVVWEDERDRLSLKDIYGQRISPDGELLWGQNGTAISSENGEQTETVLVPDGAGGIIIAWVDSRQGDRNPDIYSQRMDVNGRLLWKKDGVMVCGAPDVQRSPKIIKTEEGGAVITWTDKGGGGYDIYAQRLSPQGESLWLTDGIPVNQSARTQQNPVIGGSNIIAWEDYRYGNWDIFASAVSPQGKLLWGEEGVRVVSIPHTQYAPQIIEWKNNGVIVAGVIVAWEDYRTGKQYEIFMQKINADGKIAWQENGIMVKTFNGARAPKLLALPGENAFVVTWEDYTGGYRSLYGQKYRVE